MLHDAVHLIKNIRNNFLNYKSFILPAFEYDGFEDAISFKGGQISWKLLRKAPKITHKVLHPGNCKQNVLVGLAIFHESKSAAFTSYFPEKKNEVKRTFYHMVDYFQFYSSVQFSNHILGYVRKKDDAKPEFCRALADWD